MGGGGRVALCVRSLEVARQRQGRHVLLQGFLTSAQNMMLLFMQVNLFGVAAQRQRAGQGNLHRYDTDPRDSTPPRPRRQIQSTALEHSHIETTR